MILAGKTDIGTARSENQDDYRAALCADGSAWALVCDGMGGARGGKTAAETACKAIEAAFSAGGCEAGGEEAFLREAMKAANAAIFRMASDNADYAGMGTTAVCALLRGGTAYLAHVGDSRCYLWSGGRLTQLTHDHSYVQELVDNGRITAVEAEHHPRKNVITRALGVECSVEPEYTQADVAPGELLLLCTDGLSNAVSKNQMELLLRLQDPYAAVKSLIDAANASGGPDNITALILGRETEEKHE